MAKKRVDTGKSEVPLSSNPFSKLADTIGDGLPGAPEPAPASESPSTAPPPYSVGKTRKGGWPLSVERRGKGKVTVIGNVSGDAASLLKTLKKRCGAGGAVREDTVEIQGDQRSAIEAFLDELRG